MIIREETPRDVEAIRRVHTSAFGQPDEAALVDRLRVSPAAIAGLSIVAEIDGEIVGHILFTRLGFDPPAAVRAISLAPMAVVPQRQRTGIGSALVRHGLDRAAALGEQLVVVVGHPEYYPRFGFEPASRFRITCPYPVPDDAFLVRRLDASAGTPSGRVVYPPEFDQA